MTTQQPSQPAKRTTRPEPQRRTAEWIRQRCLETYGRAASTLDIARALRACGTDCTR